MPKWQNELLKFKTEDLGQSKVKREMSKVKCVKSNE